MARGDPSTEWIIPKINFYFQAPRLWFTYVKSFLSKITLDKVSPTVFGRRLHSLAEWLKEINSESFKFNAYTRKNTYLHVNRMINQLFWQGWRAYEKLQTRHNEEELKHYPSLRNDVVTLRVRRAAVSVSNASGQLFINESLQPSSGFHSFSRFWICNDLNPKEILKYPRGFTNFAFDDCLAAFRFSYFSWNFSLAQGLALNLTLHSLKFVGGSVNYFRGTLHCSMGSLSLNNNLTLCGQHSSVCLYSKETKSVFLTKVHPAIIFTVQAGYQVMDPLIQSVHKHFESPGRPVFVHVVANVAVAETYQIEILKTHQLIVDIIRIDSLHIVILDGPGHLSKKIVQLDTTFVLSTFICTVHALNTDFSVNDISRKLFYRSRYQPSIGLFFTQGKEINLPPISMCKQNVCLVKMLTTPGAELNVSVVHMHYEGQSSESCKYGGFTTGTLKKGLCKESQIICEDSEKNMNHFKRSFYSLNSSIILILYWFVNYSKVKVTLNLEKTTCKNVDICFCTFMRYCINPLNKNTKTESKCARYLDKLSNRHTRIKQVGFTVLVSKSNSSCAVVQIARNRSCFHLDYPIYFEPKFLHRTLGLNIEPAPNVYAPHQDKQHSIEVRGVLDQTLNKQNKLTHCMFRCGFPNGFFYKDIAERYLHHKGVKVEYFQTTPFKTDVYLFKKADNYHYLPKTLRFLEPLNSKTWLDIKLTEIQYQLKSIRMSFSGSLSLKVS